MNVVGWILVGLIAGALARWVVRDDRTGCIYTIVVGVVGGFVGGALFAAVTDNDDVFDEFDLGSIAVAFLGACLLLLVLQAIGGRGRGRVPSHRRRW